MKPRKDKSAACVVRSTMVNQAEPAGMLNSPASEPGECAVIESVRKLMALGLSTREIEELDLRRPALQAICEYARLDEPGGSDCERAANTVDATLDIVSGQMRSLNIEIEMLDLRKRALKRRTRILEKLARALESGDDDIPAA